MKVQKKFIVSLFIAAAAASLSSCASNPKTTEAPVTTTPSIAASPAPDVIAATPTPTETPTEKASPTPNNEAPEINANLPSPSPSVAKLREKTTQNEAKEKRTLSYNAIPSATEAPTGKTVDVTVYTIDSQCQDFVPQKTSVPADEPVAGAVGRALEGHDNGDFSLSGYRVNVKDGIATVDLRVSPNSKRLLSSLSSCENSSLFGSIRKTLTSNSKWNIKDVRFTEKGQEVVF
jgi:Sporulation and spore germination